MAREFRLRGQGNPSGRGGDDGDILLTVHVAPHPVFSRAGTRLDVTVPITLAEAIEGAKIDVPTPHGTVTLAIPPGTSGGKKLRLKGQGIRPANKPAGDLYVELQIELPTGLSPEDQATIAKIARRSGDEARSAVRGNYARSWIRKISVAGRSTPTPLKSYDSSYDVFQLPTSPCVGGAGVAVANSPVTDDGIIGSVRGR